MICMMYHVQQTKVLQLDDSDKKQRQDASVTWAKGHTHTYKHTHRHPSVMQLVSVAWVIWLVWVRSGSLVTVSHHMLLCVSCTYSLA